MPRVYTLSAPARRALPGEIDFPPTDRFTAGHFAIGVLMGLVKTPWWGATGVAVGWEVLERPLKRSVPAFFPTYPDVTQDTLPNAAVDAVAMIVGWGITRLLTRKG